MIVNSDKGTFTPITSKPNRNDPFIYLYNNSNNGGYSYCIDGCPTDSVCNVLSNCVGWACGRFNHIYNSITGYNKIKYPNFCCNAEKFIEVAKRYNLEVGMEPRPGSIMVWQKGTLNGCDGAGHVAVVEKVVNANTVVTSESGYGSFAFANKNRNNSNGNWGAGKSYKFRGFIYNPAVEYTPARPQQSPTNIKLPEPDKKNIKNNQIEIIVDKLRVRTEPTTNSTSIGYAKEGYYNYTEKVDNCNYTWYKIDENAWVAFNQSWIKVHNRSYKLQCGDQVCLSKDALILNSQKRFASWVYRSNLYIRSINDNKVTVSIYKSGPITGTVDEKYIQYK